MMKTKGILLTIAAAAMSAAAAAQPAAGKFSIIPRVGVSLARMSGEGSQITYITGTAIGDVQNASNKAGFAGGVDVEYQAAQQLAFSIGAHYVQQGCKYGNVRSDFASGGTNVKHYVGVNNHTVQLHSVNVPLLVSYYVAPGLAVKTGVQIGVPVSAHEKYTMAEYTEQESGEVQMDGRSDINADLDRTMRKTDFAIPVGVSFEYMNVILDARYNIGLSRVQKDPYGDSKNRVFMFTAAYRFVL